MKFKSGSKNVRGESPDLIDLRMPLPVLAPTPGDLDDILVSAIAAPEPLAMLRRYVDGLLDSSGLERPETLGLAVAHVHEIVSLIVGAARDRALADKARGPGGSSTIPRARCAQPVV